MEEKSRGRSVITEFVADDSISPEDAANQLADAVELQM
jgi:glucose/mannose transport system substrate-binding protein